MHFPVAPWSARAQSPRRLVAALLLVAASMVVTAARADAQEPDHPETARAKVAHALRAVIERGKATWYGPRFHGRRTSSGERFDMNEFTAAHPSLPFGTLVRVRNLANGREVVVRINDRLPRVRDRIIDLSKAAAAALGILKTGEARVVLLER